jgi:hypothetical protein
MKGEKKFILLSDRSPDVEQKVYVNIEKEGLVKHTEAIYTGYDFYYVDENGEPKHTTDVTKWAPL